MSWRNLLINVALALGTLLLLCLGAEAALRLVLLRNLNPFTPDPEIGYRLKSGFEGLYPRTWVRTDSHGLRVPLDQDGDSRGGLLFGGDSVTFGFGVLAEDSYPYVVGRALGAPEEVAIAAVPGYNLGQAVTALRRQARRARPRFIVVGLVVNDPTAAAHPPTYGDIDPHAARAERGGFLSRSVFVAFIQRRVLRIAARYEAPPDEGDNVIAEVEDFDTWLPPDALAAFDAQWHDLEALQRGLGVPVYVVVCPYREQVDGVAGDAFQRFVLERCGDGPLVCLDPLAALRAAGDAEDLFNGDSTFHYNPRGNRILGEWLARRIAR